MKHRAAVAALTQTHTSSLEGMSQSQTGETGMESKGEGEGERMCCVACLIMKLPVTTFSFTPTQPKVHQTQSDLLAPHYITQQDNPQV